MAAAVELNVQLDPEQINAMVSQAILQSAIGEEIRKAVEGHIRRLTTGYDSAIGKIVEKIVNEEVRNVVGLQFTPLVKEKVQESLTEELVGKLINKAWETLTQHY